MNQEKLVSIAMTTYNGEKYLREQLDSIFNQTYKNIEVIVCDDGSTDGTIEILKQYPLKYYINEENLGFVKNFQKAMSLCSGEFIAFADQDDIWLPEKIETLVSEIDDNYLVFSNLSLIDEKETITQKSFLTDLTPLKNFKKLLYHNVVTGCTAMITKDFAKNNIPFPDEIAYHDWWLAMLAVRLNKIKFVDKPLILYRQHASNHTGANIETGGKLGFISDYINRFKMLNNERKQKNRKLLSTRNSFLPALLNTNLNFTSEERKFLIDLHNYYNGFLGSKISIKDLNFAFNNRDFFSYSAINPSAFYFKHIIIYIFNKFGIKYC